MDWALSTCANAARRGERAWRAHCEAARSCFCALCFRFSCVAGFTAGVSVNGCRGLIGAGTSFLGCLPKELLRFCSGAPALLLVSVKLGASWAPAATSDAVSRLNDSAAGGGAVAEPGTAATSFEALEDLDGLLPKESERLSFPALLLLAGGESGTGTTGYLLAGALLPALGSLEKDSDRRSVFISCRERRRQEAAHRHTNAFSAHARCGRQLAENGV